MKPTDGQVPMHAVLFDIDGTLIQSAAVDDTLYKQSVTAVLGPVEFRASLNDYRFVTDSGILAQVLTDNAIRPDKKLLAEIKSRFVDALSLHIDEYGPFQEVTGARQLLNNLYASENHSVAIATGGWRETAVLKLESAKFEVSEMPLATSDDALERTEIMRTALSKIGDHFESVTYYGDGPWDRDACVLLDWNFVAVGPTLGGLASYADVDIV